MKKIPSTIVSLRLRCCISLLVLYFAGFNLYALEGDSRFWQRIGPEGATTYHFITNQQQTDVIYVSSKSYSGSNSKYFKSLNAGNSWVALPEVPSSAENHLTNIPYNLLNRLSVDSENPHILYAYSTDGFIKSLDNAMHWQLLGNDLNMNTDSFFPLNPFITQSLRVLTNTEDPHLFDMAISQDGGQQWTTTDKRIYLYSEEVNAEIRIESSDPKNPEILYGVSYSPGDFLAIYPPLPHILYKSINGGLDWVNITPEGKSYSAWSIIFTDNKDKLYATFATSEWGGGEQTLVSHNGGQDWELLGIASENSVDFNLSKLYIDPVDSQILYANVYAANSEERENYPNRIAKSNNAGQSWQVIDTSPYPPGEIIINAQNNLQLLMTSEPGVLRSEDGGINWISSNAGMYGLTGNLSIAKDDDSMMYFVTGSNANIYYKSSDGGQHWERFMTKDPVQDNCSRFLINPVNNKQILCQNSHLYSSNDAGDHWELLGSGARGEIIYTIDGARMYAFYSNRLSKSSDNGKSWSTVANIIDRLDPDSAAVYQEFSFFELPILDPINPNILYSLVFADSSKRLYKSVDYGKTWQLLVENTLPGTRKLLIHPLNSERLIYTIGDEKALLSENAGESWEEIPMTLSDAAYSEPDIIFDPNDLDGLFWAVRGGVYYSKDLGARWDLIDQGLDSNENVTLMTSSKGVFVTSDIGIYQLSEQVDMAVVSDCLFQWAEASYPDIFSPGSSHSQEWGGYTYRYYQKSNTYLGFFYAQEVHLNQADISSKIDVIGSVDFYRELTGCD